MGKDIFEKLMVHDVHQDLFRNIVSIRISQNLFDDLSDDPDELAAAQQVESDVKPSNYQSRTPIIDRPFEDAIWFNAIKWPFENKSHESRFSNGAFGVWYGCGSLETTVYETVYHWVNGLLRNAGFDTESVVGERKAYTVACEAALLDFRPILDQYPDLSRKSDYSYPQMIGARLHREGHPGLITKSVRRPAGDNFVIFNPNVLSNPQSICQLTYRFRGERVLVEREPGTTWMEINVNEF